MGDWVMKPKLYLPKDSKGDPWERFMRWLKDQVKEGSKIFKEAQGVDCMFVVALWTQLGEVPTKYLNLNFSTTLSLNGGDWSAFSGEAKPKKPRLHKSLSHTLTLIEQMRRVAGEPRIGLVFWVRAGVEYRASSEYVELEVS